MRVQRRFLTSDLVNWQCALSWLSWLSWPPDSWIWCVIRIRVLSSAAHTGTKFGIRMLSALHFSKAIFYCSFGFVSPCLLAMCGRLREPSVIRTHKSWLRGRVYIFYLCRTDRTTHLFYLCYGALRLRLPLKRVQPERGGAMTRGGPRIWHSKLFFSLTRSSPSPISFLCIIGSDDCPGQRRRDRFYGC